MSASWSSAEAAPYSWLPYTDAQRNALSLSHLRQLGQSLLLYASQHKANYAPNFAAVVSTQQIEPNVFANPRTGTLLPRAALSSAEQLAWVDARRDYIYRGAGLKASTISSTAVLAYENPDREFGDIDILWGDGHVSTMARSDAAALIGFPDAPPSDPPPPAPSVAPADPKVLASQANERAIVAALMHYANTHRGGYPQDLGTLYPYYLGDLSVFINPRGNTQLPPDGWTIAQKVQWIDQSSDYLYFGGLGLGSHIDRLVIIENPDSNSGGVDVSLNDGSSQFMETRWAEETIAANPPSVVRGAYQPDSKSISFALLPGIDPSSLSSGDVGVRGETGGTVSPASSAIAVQYAPTPQGGVITVSFPGLANGLLPDGDYRIGLAPNVLSNAAGVNNAGFSAEDFVFTADANYDRTVDTLDFNSLAGNFGGSNKLFSQGDFNYDGIVDTLDFNILANKFGQTLAPYGTIFISAGSATTSFSAHPIRSDGGGLAADVLDIAADQPLA